MGALVYKELLIDAVTKESRELLQGRGNLPREDLEYVVEAIARMKDVRLKECIADLIGWGDDERARLETQVAIGIEAMKLCSPYKLREAATRVEMRTHLRMVKE